MKSEDIYKTDINNREELDKLGYNSDLYYCGNYNMQKYYSYIYNKLRALGVKFAMNRACFIHDLNYHQKPNLKQKILIDWQFYNDMQKCILFEFREGNISIKHAMWLRLVAGIFYGIVVLATPFYLKQGKISK